MRSHQPILLAFLVSAFSIGLVVKAQPNPDDFQVDKDALELRSTNISCFADGVLVHWPPIGYPKVCLDGASNQESVVVRWDLAVDGGAPENIVVLKSSNACFNSAVVEGLKKRKYPPTRDCQKGAKI